jgi:hypothetical protein
VSIRRHCEHHYRAVAVLIFRCHCPQLAFAFRARGAICAASASSWALTRVDGSVRKMGNGDHTHLMETERRSVWAERYDCGVDETVPCRTRSR